MRQMIIRLLMAKLIPVGIKLVTGLFKKKKSAVDPNLESLSDAQNEGAVEKLTD